MKTIILDFDGTIADTKGIIIDTFSKTLKAIKQPKVDNIKIQRAIGLPLGEMFIQVANLTDNVQVEKAVAKYREIFGDASKHTVSMFPHVGETLRTLYEKGITLAVASSRSHASLEDWCNKFGMANYITSIFGVEDVVKKKPAPEMVLKILEKTLTPAKDALVVGDTIYDIQMGQGAGCKTCGVTYGNNTAEQLRSQKADYIIDDFARILGIVEV